MSRKLLPHTRRALLKTLGAGAGLSAVGTAAATEERTDAAGNSGQSTPGAVHEVTTRVAEPSTSPDRPADFFYQPTGLHVQPGDVVRYVFETPDHNVVSMHPAFGMRRRVPTGVAAFSSPLLGWRSDSIPDDRIEPPGEGEAAPVPDTWLHSFETPGVYDIVCSPHEQFGMAMRVVVGDVREAPFETADPSALPGPRAGPVGLARVTLTDPALEPATIVERGRVDWQSLRAVRSADGETNTPTGESGEA